MTKANSELITSKKNYLLFLQKNNKAIKKIKEGRRRYVMNSSLQVPKI